MPIQRHKYPPDWPDISRAVRTEADWCCERCGVPNQAVIKRLDTVEIVRVQSKTLMRIYLKDWQLAPSSVLTPDGSGLEFPDTMTWKRLRLHGLTRIILTAAHLDRDPSNNLRENLAALCQRCHLRHDVHQRITNRRYGRDHDRAAQLKLV